MSPSLSWIALQLSDSAFPSGAFVHSGGLEAAWRLGELAADEDLEAFVDATVWQAGSAQWPFVGGAHGDPSRHAEIDASCDAFLLGHVTNRASRSQGRALVGSASRVFGGAELVALDERLRRRELPGHFAPAFGVVARLLGLSRDETCRLGLHAALRGVVSAAVRLGLVGPHEAQRMIHTRADLLDRVLVASLDLGVDEAAQSAPILEILATAHDRLQERLFVS
jgi:urease accessory protein